MNQSPACLQSFIAAVPAAAVPAGKPRRRALSRVIAACSVALAMTLGGCASPVANLRPGQSTASDVQASMGATNQRIANADGGETWFYPQGELSALTYAVHLGKDGVVRGIEQTRVPEKIPLLRQGSMTTREVFSLFGPPDHVTRFERKKQNSWSYRIRDGAPEPMVLYTEFSDDGVLREVTYLRAREADNPFPFSFMRGGI